MDNKVLMIGGAVLVVVVLVMRSSSSGGIKTIAPLPAQADPTQQARLSAASSAFNALASVYGGVTQGAQKETVALAQTEAERQIETARTAATIENTRITSAASVTNVAAQQATQRRKDSLSFWGNIVNDTVGVVKLLAAL